MTKTVKFAAFCSAGFLLCFASRAAETATNAPAALSKSSLDLFPDKVVARGKTFEIKRSEVDEAFVGFKTSLSVQRQTIPESKREEVLNQVLDRLINVQVLLSKATEADKAKAKEEAEKAFIAYREKVPSEEAFKRQFIALGMTVEKFRARLVDEAIFKTVIDRELRPTIKIPESQIKTFYQTNAAKYSLPERVQIRRILILTQDPATRQDLPDAQKLERKHLAESILGRAKTGEDFAALAKEYSDDPRTREAGGLADPFPRGYMVPEIDRMVFAMQPNQISDLIQTPFGYQIIKFVEKLPPRIIPLAEAEPGIRELLERQEIQKALPEYLKRLRTEAGVEIPERLQAY
jgi:parvulin-like peptidyl-prolyl isomerase